MDLFVIASLAVNPATGERSSPKGSSEDLEYGVLQHMGAVERGTPVVTCVHDAAVVEGAFWQRVFDIGVDAGIICTPTRTIRTAQSGSMLAVPHRLWQVLMPRGTPTARHRVLQQGQSGSEEEVAPGGDSSKGGPLSTGLLHFDAMARANSPVSSFAVSLDTDDFDLDPSQFEKLPEFQRASFVRVGLGWRAIRLRLAVLKAGKKLLVPRPTSSDYAASVTDSGVDRLGRLADLDADLRVDLFVISSLAVHPITGQRLSPAEGLEELEYGALRQFRVVNGSTPVVTCIHDSQLSDSVDDVFFPQVVLHNAWADVICTATRSIWVARPPFQVGAMH